jgi:hypothetical protein
MSSVNALILRTSCRKARNVTIFRSCETGKWGRSYPVFTVCTIPILRENCFIKKERCIIYCFVDVSIDLRGTRRIDPKVPQESRKEFCCVKGKQFPGQGKLWKILIFPSSHQQQSTYKCLHFWVYVVNAKCLEAYKITSLLNNFVSLLPLNYAIATFPPWISAFPYANLLCGK